ncbi:MBL fold metallo-hydrolase [Bacterioplanoides pacificum]|uniref:MBL fold metallo-hydrolase n=1 Tax=Bacterioplanoides pacificum TaxID=1171596 RepID=A0ABV7VR27_9GAMM
MSHSSLLRFLLLLASVLLAACSSKLHLPTYQQPTASQTISEDQLSIQYLGVGGHILSYNGSKIMTAPSFSNPHFLLAGPFFPMSADKEAIDTYMPAAKDVSMILVGHAHYDHLLDVPYVMQQHTPDAHVYGSETMAHTLAGSIDKQRIHALNDKMGDVNQPGEWIYGPDGKVRIMALKSAHAPHIMGIKFMGGHYDEDQQDLPWHAFGWKEGQTLAYIIDFLNADQSVAHRIFYQDAASQEPAGLVPPLADGKAIDIAILCPASFSQIDDYPESVIRNTQAKHFILGHWEDFFANDLEGEQRFVRLTDQDEFIQRLEAAKPANSTWVLPQLFSTQYFSANGALIQ